MKLCQCGCGKLAVGRSIYDPDCSKRIRKIKKDGYNRKRSTERTKKCEVKEVKPVKRGLTDEEIDRRAIEQVRAERKAEEELAKVRATLNPRLLAIRAYNGALAIAEVRHGQ